MAPEEEGASVEAVVAAEEGDGGEEGEDGVVACGEVCGGPGGVIVGWGELGEGVNVFPGEVGEGGEVERRRCVFDGSRDDAVCDFGAGDGFAIED